MKLIASMQKNIMEHFFENRSIINYTTRLSVESIWSLVPSGMLR